MPQEIDRSDHLSDIRPLRSDRALLAATALIVSLAVLFTLTLFPRHVVREYWAFHAEATLVVLAVTWVSFRSARSARFRERHFWALLALAYLLYLGSYVVFYVLRWRDVSTPWRMLGQNTFNLLYYAAVFLAVATKPDFTGRWGPAVARYRLELTATVVFTVALFTYMVIIPLAWVPEKHVSSAHTAILYTGLDLALIVGFLLLRRDCQDERWRRVYLLLAFSSGMCVGLDAFEGLFFLGWIAYAPGSALDVLWLIPYVPLFLATRVNDGARSKHAGAVSREERLGRSIRSPRGGLVVLYLAALPVVHFALYASQALGPANRLPREICVVVASITLGVIAFLTQRRQRAEQLQLETELRQAQKMEAVGRLASGVAHDFNNLLTVINGYSELIMEKVQPGNRIREYADRIHEAGQKASLVTSKLLAFGRQQPMNPQVVNLGVLIADLSAMLRRLIGENIELKLSADPNLWNVFADPTQIEQVVVNIVVNSKDAMPDGGRLVIETRNIAGAVSAGSQSARKGRWVLVRITDTGCGMDDETVSHAFEPFFTTKDIGRGTGLGLSTALGIVEQHGGWIDVESNPGCGTAVTICLPGVEKGAPAALSKSSPISISRGGRETVLVVEDDRAVLTVVATVLARHGYTVLRAAGYREAMEQFRHHRQKVELLVTDIVLADGTGPDLHAAFIAEGRPIKVLFISGYSEDKLSSIGKGAGVVGMLQKPFDAAEISARVRAVLDAPNAPAEPRAKPGGPRPTKPVKSRSPEE